MTDAAPRTLTVDDLQPGDLLMSMARTELAKLIAWVGDTRYSHAAVVLSKDDLIEATPPRVRLFPLAQRADQGNRLHYLDVWRPTMLHGRPLAPDDLQALQAAGRDFLGRDYATGMLPYIAIAGAIRTKTPADPAVCWILKRIVDYVMTDDAATLICTELAYRVYAEGRYSRPDLLKPDLVWVPPQHPPMPEFDLVELYRELRDMLGPAAPSGMVPATATGTELAASYACLRTRFGLQPMERVEQGALPSRPVNPKTVILVDLQWSPSFRALGRLKLTRPFT